MHRPLLCAASALLLLIACAAPNSTSSGEEASEFAPTPYSAQQIRASNPPGTMVVYKIWAKGQSELTSTFEFGESDADTVLLGGRVLTAAGDIAQDSTAARVRWDELRDHAKFPAQSTTRSEASIRTQAGEFDCWLYEVVDVEGGTLSRFWFAKQRAGSPVQMTVTSSGEEVYRMEMFAIRATR